MNTPLVLFTSNHPFTYKGGETMFVGPELPALVAAFGGVLVVPLYDEGNQLELPTGCAVDRGLARRWHHARWFWVLRALGWPGFACELWRGLRVGGAVGAARVWRWAAVAAATWHWMCRSGQHEPLLYSYWRGGQTLAAARWAEEHGTSAVTRVHRYELYDEAFAPPFQPWTSMYGKLALVITVAQQGADYLRARGVDRVTVARLGVNAAAQRAVPSTDGAWRVVSTSSLTPVKRVERNAAVLVELARRVPDRRIEWTHFGAGPARSAVQDVLRDAPANLKVDFAGQVPNETVLAHYCNHPVDGFLLLSCSEGLPVSIQEALAHGIPVMATDVGGVAEAVSSDEGALVQDSDSIARIADALQALLSAPDHKRVALRAAAWQRWARDFDARRNHATLASRLFELFKHR